MNSLVYLLIRDVIYPEAHGNEQPKLFLERQLIVARVRHIAAHYAC